MSLTLDIGFNRFVASVVENCMEWAEESQFPVLFRLIATKCEQYQNKKSFMEIAYEDLKASPNEVANDILNEIILSNPPR